MVFRGGRQGYYSIVNKEMGGVIKTARPLSTTTLLGRELILNTVFQNLNSKGKFLDIENINFTPFKYKTFYFKSQLLISICYSSRRHQK